MSALPATGRRVATLVSMNVAERRSVLMLVPVPNADLVIVGDRGEVRRPAEREEGHVTIDGAKVGAATVEGAVVKD